MPQVNLAVVGAQGVGKSTFIKFALDLKQRPISRSSTKKMSLDGTIYLVRLLEIAIDQVTFDKHGEVVWPSFLGEQVLPAIDGVLGLYDSTDLTSVARFPRIFGKCPKTVFPSCSFCRETVIACAGNIVQYSSTRLVLNVEPDRAGQLMRERGACACRCDAKGQ